MIFLFFVSRSVPCVVVRLFCFSRELINYVLVLAGNIHSLPRTHTIAIRRLIARFAAASTSDDADVDDHIGVSEVYKLLFPSILINLFLNILIAALRSIVSVLPFNTRKSTNVGDLIRH